MSKFALEEIEILHSRIKFFKLVRNDTCEFDDFIEEISLNGNYEVELDSIQTIIEMVAQMQRVSPGKFKELSKNGKDPHKDYEIRTPNLRVYLFKADEGKIIVTGAKKSPKNQQQDIARLRMIKKEFFQERNELVKSIPTTKKANRKK